MKRILCVAALPLFALPAFAGNVDEAYDRFESAVNNSVKEAAKSPQPEAGRIAAYYPGALMRLKSLIATGEIQAAKEMLQQMCTAVPSSPETQKAYENLAVALDADMNAKEKAYAEQIGKLIERASADVQKAKTAVELDPILKDLAEARSRQEVRRYSNEQTQGIRNRLEGTYRYVTKWQDYLAAAETGNAEAARNALRNILDNDMMLRPRSEVLALSQRQNVSPDVEPKQSADEAAAELISKTKGLQDLGDLQRKLKKLRDKRGPGTDSISPLIQNADQLDRFYREYQGGLPPTVEAINNQQISGSLTRFKKELLLLVIPSAVGAPQFKAKPDETPLELLGRIAAQAKEEGNINQAVRVREITRQLQRGFNSGADNVSSYQAAQNQETAGQWDQAVVSYQNALKSGGDLMPAKLIGERLTKIKKDHPEEYEKGMERFNNPSVQTYPFPGRVMPPRPELTGRPGLPGTAALPPAPSPSATPSPIATPTPAPSPAK